MISFGLTVFAVMLMLEPDVPVVKAGKDERYAEEADAGFIQGNDDGSKHARIRSRTSDFDRQEGVGYFEGNVLVEYDNGYALFADSLYVFLSESNRLSRVVANGRVSITNETRVGKCAIAVYNKLESQIDMYGAGKSLPASLKDGTSMVEGSHIRFWIDSEQVEVERSRISVERSDKGGVL